MEDAKAEGGESVRKPDVPTNATAAAPTKKITAKWLVRDPSSGSPGPFSYYFNIAKAFDGHDKVEVCTSSVQHCSQKGSIFVALLDPITTTEGKGPIVHALKSLRIPSSKPTCFIVVGMINKAYQNMADKMKAFTTTLQRSGMNSISIHLMATTWSPHTDELSKKYNVPFTFIPFATDTTVFNLTTQFTPWEDRQCDVFLRWDTNPDKYQLRKEIHSMLVQTADIKVSSPSSFLKEEQYIQEIVKCKMSITTIGMPPGTPLATLDLFGTRYFEIMASGTTLLIAQRPKSKEAKLASEQLGLVDGETIVEIDNVTELLGRIQYYKANPKKAYEIIRRAQANSMRHTWADRADRMVNAIQKFAEHECDWSGRQA
jgi:hypothetical protein